MNKIELQEWIKSAKLIDTPFYEYDKCNNCHKTCIYSKDGKLYRIDFLNGDPNPVFGPKGWIEGTYQIKEVISTTKTVEVVEYIDKL